MSQQTEILREIRERLLQLKSYARRMLTMDSKRAILQQFHEIYKLFPDNLKLSFVVENVEQRLPNTIDVKLRDLESYLTYYIPDEHPGLEYIEEELRNIRTALGEFREANKSVQDMPTREKVEKDSKTEDKGTPGEAHKVRESGLWNRIKKGWENLVRNGKKHEETKKLLMDLKALEMSMDEV